jgi:membrane peptidoglycan carboxypeptidase
MARLQQPLNASAAASIAKEVVSAGEPTFTLGQEPTSALELTGAFAAAVNGGVWCPPHPVLRITGPTGRALHVPVPACHRVLTPWVAHTITTFMRADTTRGTAASYFQNWYAHGGPSIAGKTGTDNNAADNGNSALWFVGMTPRLVAAASIVDPDHPKATVHGLPGLPDPFVAQDVFGAYASTYWLDAYAPALRGTWDWSVPSLGGPRVPTVVGDTRAAAIARLRSAGYQASVFPVTCGSDRPSGVVAYQEPPQAEPGTVVTICMSNGVAPYAYTPPPYVPPPAPPPRRVEPPAPPHRHHHGGGNSQ